MKIKELLCISVWFFRGAKCSSWRCSDVPGGSRTEYSLGRVTSYDEVPSAAQSHPMHFASKLQQHLTCVWQKSVRWFDCGILTCSAEVFLLRPGDGNISTETEIRSQIRRRRTIVTWRLVPLAGRAPFLCASGSRERSRLFLVQVFHNCIYCFKWG